jgi:galactokinase
VSELRRSDLVRSRGLTSRTYRAPGRVNIIGEHIDYLGGTVLPFACDLELRIIGTDADEVALRSRDGDVAPYVSGVRQALREAGYGVGGFAGEITSTIPIGAGLSSSAALEVALALALTRGAEVPPDVLRRSEELASGVRGGVMDQTAVLRARADHALLLDCASGAIEYVPIPPSVGFVVVDTGTRRQLADGRYAQRRTEVEARDPKRVRHASSEQGRVYDAAEALRSGDVTALGALVSASHASLRDDFEVSSPALDEAVAAAEEHPSCRGARLVGAGFAGCVLAVVEAGAEDDVSRLVTGRLPAATAFKVKAVDAACEVVI